MNNEKYFRNACRAATEHWCSQYLLSNVRHDGALKATIHDHLTRFYVAVALGCGPDHARRPRGGGDEALYKRVHDHTQKLTSHLDREIGFKIDGGAHEAVALGPAFFDKFHDLAMEAVREAARE